MTQHQETAVEQSSRTGSRTGMGLGMILVVFIIFAAGVMAVTWFQANILGGAEKEAEILSQSEMDDIDYRLQNALVYMQEAFFTSSERGTDEAAGMSGRYKNESQFRYWYCKGSPQPATVREVRNASSTFIMQDFAERLNEVHGIRNGYIYQVGALQCTETGYREPFDTPQNDRFTTAYMVNGVNVTRTDGSVKRGVDNATQGKEIFYNRLWYMYDVLKRWVEQEDMKDNVREELAKVRDSKARENTRCITGPEQCVYPQPYSCQIKHKQWLDRAVNHGLDREMRKLELEPEYFNGTNVDCRVTFNTDDAGTTFPGHEVIPRVNRRAENTSVKCGNNPSRWQYRCITEWYLAFESYLDYTVICEDQKFNTVPRDKLEHLDWNIDVSYTVTEQLPDGEFDIEGTRWACLEHAEPPVSYLPLQLNECNVGDTDPERCETPVDTTGTLEDSQ